MLTKAAIREDHPTKRTISFAGQTISASALAVKLKVSPSCISYIFSGKRNPSIPLAKRLAAELGMDPWRFLALLDQFTHDRPPKSPPPQTEPANQLPAPPKTPFSIKSVAPGAL
jgi:transcriptional regulator with XRE-family HTH domain